MRVRNILIAAGAIAAVAIVFSFLIGPSLSRLFFNDESIQTSATVPPVISLSVDQMYVNKTSDSTAQIHMTFAAHNQGKNTAILDNVQYGIYANNSTKIAFGSIGQQTDDVIQGQASVYPVISGDTVRLSVIQTLDKSEINNGIMWNGIMDGHVRYIIRGIYTLRDNSNLQAEGIQKDFEIIFPSSQTADVASTMKLAKSIQLPGVQGRIDHLSVDLPGKRLFVAELGNNSVDVIDLQSGKRLHAITGLSEPQAALFIPKLNKIFVSNGGNGTVGIYDASSYSLISTTKLGSDADNIRYDNATGLVYIGYGDGALAILNPNGTHSADIAMSGHPESFQIEESGNRIFVNVPADNSIKVADKGKHQVIAEWTPSALQNFPMALDESNHRLFVGTRDPAKMLVIDTETGKEVASIDTVKDADDISYDSSNKQIYVSGGEGFIEVFKQQDADHYNSVSKIPTLPGARTMLFLPELQQLYLAVPQHDNRDAELWIYSINT